MLIVFIILTSFEGDLGRTFSLDFVAESKFNKKINTNELKTLVNQKKFLVKSFFYDVKVKLRIQT